MAFEASAGGAHDCRRLDAGATVESGLQMYVDMIREPIVAAA